MTSLYCSFVVKGVFVTERLIQQLSAILSYEMEKASIDYSALSIEMLFGHRFLSKVVGVFIFTVL